MPQKNFKFASAFEKTKSFPLVKTGGKETKTEIIMDALIQFSIPVKGLGNGIHEYRFHIDKSFFDQFEHSPIQDGSFEVNFIFDKRPEMFDLHFDFMELQKPPVTDVWLRLIFLLKEITGFW